MTRSLVHSRAKGSVSSTVVRLWSGGVRGGTVRRSEGKTEGSGKVKYRRENRRGSAGSKEEFCLRSHTGFTSVEIRYVNYFISC